MVGSISFRLKGCCFDLRDAKLAKTPNVASLNRKSHVATLHTMLAGYGKSTIMLQEFLILVDLDYSYAAVNAKW